MTIPGIGPIISSAVVAAIGNGTAFTRGRDFAAWLGLVMPPVTGARDAADISAAVVAAVGLRIVRRYIAP